jgi:hypothetical protein
VVAVVNVEAARQTGSTAYAPSTAAAFETGVPGVRLRSGPVAGGAILVLPLVVAVARIPAEVPAAGRLPARTAADCEAADLLTSPPTPEVARGVLGETGRVPDDL